MAGKMPELWSDQEIQEIVKRIHSGCMEQGCVDCQQAGSVEQDVCYAEIICELWRKWHNASNVVHCGECKYWWKQNGLCANPRHCDGNLCSHECDADDYCSDGKVKERAKADRRGSAEDVPEHEKAVLHRQD